MYLSVSICRICVVRSPHRAAAVRPPRDERLLGRRHCAAPLLANEARLVARLGEDEFGCEGALHRGVAPQDKGRAHRGKGAALRFDLVRWQVVEPVGSRENTRADFGLGPVPSLTCRRCLGPPPGRGKQPSAIGGNVRWRASERYQDAFFQRAIGPLENARHVATHCKIGDEVGHFAVAANEAVHAHGDASQFLDPLSQPGAGVARADSL